MPLIESWSVLRNTALKSPPSAIVKVPPLPPDTPLIPPLSLYRSLLQKEKKT